MMKIQLMSALKISSVKRVTWCISALHSVHIVLQRVRFNLIECEGHVDSV